MGHQTFIICYGVIGGKITSERKVTDKSLNDICEKFEQAANNTKLMQSVKSLYIYAPATDTLQVLRPTLFGYMFECSFPTDSSKMLPGAEYREFVDSLVAMHPDCTALLRGSYASKQRLSKLFPFYKKSFVKTFNTPANGELYSFLFLEKLGIQSDIALYLYPVKDNPYTEDENPMWYSVPFADKQVFNGDTPVTLDNTALSVCKEAQNVDTFYNTPFTGEEAEFDSDEDTYIRALVTPNKDEIIKRCVEFSAELIWSGTLSWFARIF